MGKSGQLLTIYMAQQGNVLAQTVLTNYHRLIGLHNRNLCLIFLEGGQSKVKVQLLVRALFLDCRQLYFQRIHT